jgi:paraquat-inducible protein A
VTTDLTCSFCGQEQKLGPLRPGDKAVCCRCAIPLAVGRRWGQDAPLSFALTGLILFLPAVLLPLVGADELGNRRVSLLPTGVGALWGEGMHWLSLLVLFCGVLLPAALLLALIGWFAPPGLSRRWIGRSALGRVAKTLGTWAYPEVQVLAVIVGVIKLHSLAHLEIGPGFWCYAGMTGALWLARREFEITPDRGAEAAVTERAAEAGWLGSLKGKSRSRCAALALTALVLLAPANLLPVLTTETSGDNRTDTIFSGAMQLSHQGLWELAAIVFTASMLIPGLKLVGLGVLLFNSGPTPPGRARQLTRLYEWLALIGRWSMLDVFLAAFLVGLVEFGEFATVKAQTGLIAFSAVVVLTVLATDSFDPREIWSAPRRPWPT